MSNQNEIESWVKSHGFIEIDDTGIPQIRRIEDKGVSVADSEKEATYLYGMDLEAVSNFISQYMSSLIEAGFSSLQVLKATELFVKTIAPDLSVNTDTEYMLVNIPFLEGSGADYAVEEIQYFRDNMDGDEDIDEDDEI